MELVYLWVERDKNIKNQGFNFSPNYHIENSMSTEDKDGKICIYPFGTIKITTKSKSPEFLFGNNIVNITAIVGENGTGKTNVLKIICAEISKDFIFNDKDYPNKKDNLITFKTSGKDKTVYIDQNKLEPSDFKDERTVIYYDNIFKSKYIKESLAPEDKRVEDISTGTLFKNLNEKYDSNEIKNQMIFIQSKEANELKKELPELILPKEFSFSNITDFFLQYQLQEKKEYKEFLEIENRVKKEVEKELNNFNDKINNEYFKESFILYFQITILKIALISTPKENMENMDDVVTKFIEIFSEFNKKITEFENNNSQEYKSLSPKGIRKENIGLSNGDYGKKRSQLIKSLLNFKKWNKEIESLLRTLKLSENLKITYDENFNFLENQENSKYLFFNKLELDLEKNGKHLNKLMNINKENSVEYHFFEYSWLELSSGEKAILSLFSRFYSIKDKISNEFILILLDEPELYFHPEWQRKFIKMFIKFINELFKDKKVQIIMTSHSPFVVSDLPKENVIMLGKYKETDEEYDTDLYKIGGCKVKPRKIDTFGANIFTLYKEAFFVESSFGEFAREKIQNVVNLYETNIDKNGNITYPKEIDIEDRKNEIKYIINSVGEPLIKRKLQNMCDEYEKNKLNNDEDKKLLEKFDKLSIEEKLELMRLKKENSGDVK